VCVSVCCVCTWRMILYVYSVCVTVRVMYNLYVCIGFAQGKGSGS